MQLLIEAGNTFVKLARYWSDRPMEYVGKYPNKQLELVLEPILTEVIERIVFASVGPVEIENAIQRIASQANIAVMQVKTPKQDFGVSNAYQEYQYLGIDRWLTLVAMHQKSAQNRIIIDIGTALTFDVLCQSGKHLGGWITPGYQLMMDSVLNNTAKVFSHDRQTDCIKFANNTADGLNHGCRAALLGVIELGIRQAQEQWSASPQVILCGGGVQHLPKSFVEKHQCCFDLVLDGLSLYAERESCSKKHRLISVI